MKRGRLLLTLIFLYAAFGCAVTGVSLPAVTDAPTGRHDVGRVIWRDLISDTPAESRRFYEELFGWEFEAVGGLFNLGGDDAYSLIRHNGRLIGGMVNQASLNNARGDISQWVVLMSVADADEASRRFAAEGGQILTPPTDVADRGRMAVVVDPQGALLALVETRDGDPPQWQPGIGDFLWDELWTSDVGAGTAFYRNLVGLGERDVDAGEGSYRMLTREDRPAFGILAHPFAKERPVWVTYIRVEDPAAITARVPALGGRVYVEAQERPLGGRVALIADPSGAGIALQTWSFTEEAD
ncbi:MAG: VOC family protein [Pseudomonadales bacterium]